MRDILKNDMAEAYLSFCAFCAEAFESFLLKFQFDQPMIHKLYVGMLALLTNLMKKFIKKKSQSKDLKTGQDLLEINVSRSANHKSLNCFEIGTKARLHFNKYILLTGDEAMKFRRKSFGGILQHVSRVLDAELTS